MGLNLGQGLRALALIEDLGSVPSTLVSWLSNTCNPSAGGIGHPLSATVGTADVRDREAGIYIYMTYIDMKIHLKEH